MYRPSSLAASRYLCICGCSIRLDTVGRHKYLPCMTSIVSSANRRHTLFFWFRVRSLLDPFINLLHFPTFTRRYIALETNIVIKQKSAHSDRFASITLSGSGNDGNDPAARRLARKPKENQPCGTDSPTCIYSKWKTPPSHQTHASTPKI